MEEENKLEKNSNAKIRFKWGLILLFLAIILYTGASIVDSGLVKNATELHTLIANGDDHEGEYATITLAYLPYNFATGNTENNVFQYYFALDDNGYVYIVRITDSTYEYLSNIAGEDGELVYEMTGYTFDTSSELKQIAIESYNELIDSELLTEENFEEYMGNVYIDEINTPQNNVVLALHFIAKLLALIAIILLIVCLISKSKNRKDK